MPILDVEIVGPVPASARPDLARRIADAAGGVFGSGPQNTWVKVRFLEEDAYAENMGGPPPGVRPVLVSVLLAVVPPPERLSEQTLRLSQALAEICDRPVENIHIIVEPPAAGRVAFGGKLGR